MSKKQAPPKQQPKAPVKETKVLPKTGEYKGGVPKLENPPPPPPKKSGD